MTICQKRSPAGSIVGAPCDECGHTSLLHPNSGNPTVTHCLVCEIVTCLAT